MKLTAEEFKAAVEENPAWAASLTEPVEVTGYCDMEYSQITHLSPMLRFTGLNKDRSSANFSHCQKLKTAEGFFAGYVNFYNSAIEKIGDLIITNPDSNGDAACFTDCGNLKVAEGTFPGFVSFSGTGIEKIEDLHITSTDPSGVAVDFSYCKNLRIAEGTFRGSVFFSDSAIEKIGELEITQPDKDGDAAIFYNCPNLKIAEGTFPGHVDFRQSGIKTIGALITKPNRIGKSADFTDCHLQLPRKYLGDQFTMDDALRQKNLNRIAATRALKTRPDLEI